MTQPTLNARETPHAGPALGAVIQPDGRCSFLVWAPKVTQIEVCLLGSPERVIPLTRNDAGYHSAMVDEITAGTRYWLRLDGAMQRPDPASRCQPEGVHGPSGIIDPAFSWEDQAWPGLPLRDFIIYELHIGTFSNEGTFDGAIGHLPKLKELGINAIEIMPVAQFPGERNWGYDGVGLFAVQNSYGGPAGLRRLVNACHRQGLAVILDVVYNHLGPEGNYLGDFGPYFTDAYRTPWGAALNFDTADSVEVRRFFLENALHWHRDYHIDALRLDAVHSIRDFSALPFLQQLTRAAEAQAHELGRPFHLIAETDLNAPRFVLPESAGGYGLDGQWSDDFHHCLHVLLTGEQSGYYEDFGGVAQLAKVFREGYAYTGQYSRHRRALQGNSPAGIAPQQLVVCSQNHDQVGNRAAGERLTQLVDFESLKLAAGAVLLSPFIPMLFMGEEHAEPAPFQYMISHGDPALIGAVRTGRRAEFASFGWADAVPDPQDEATFLRSRVDHSLRHKGPHRIMFELYCELIRLRKELRLLGEITKGRVKAWAMEEQNALVVQYDGGDNPGLLLVLGFSTAPARLKFHIPSGTWRKLFDSAAPQWHGPGEMLPTQLQTGEVTELPLTPRTAALYQKV